MRLSTLRIRLAGGSDGGPGSIAPYRVSTVPDRVLEGFPTEGTIDGATDPAASDAGAGSAVDARVATSRDPAGVGEGAVDP